MSLKDRILQIKKLHPELGYFSIAKILGCAKNTVKHHISSSARLSNAKRQRRHRSAIRLEYKTKAGGRCQKCGYDKFLEVLDFHHRDPSNKSAGLGSLFSEKGRKHIEEEIAKCDLLCANCHREVHIHERFIAR